MAEKTVVYVDDEKCTGCGLCVESCLPGAISLSEGVARIDKTRCTGCQACLDVCRQGAIYSVIPAVPAVAATQQLNTTTPGLPVSAPAGGKLALAGKALSALAPVALDLAVSTIENWASGRVSKPGGGQASTAKQASDGTKCAGGGGLHRRRRGQCS